MLTLCFPSRPRLRRPVSSDLSPCPGEAAETDEYITVAGPGADSILYTVPTQTPTEGAPDHAPLYAIPLDTAPTTGAGAGAGAGAGYGAMMDLSVPATVVSNTRL